MQVSIRVLGTNEYVERRPAVAYSCTHEDLLSRTYSVCGCSSGSASGSATFPRRGMAGSLFQSARAQCDPSQNDHCEPDARGHYQCNNGGCESSGIPALHTCSAGHVMGQKTTDTTCPPGGSVWTRRWRGPRTISISQPVVPVLSTPLWHDGRGLCGAMSTHPAEDPDARSTNDRCRFLNDKASASTLDVDSQREAYCCWRCNVLAMPRHGVSRCTCS